MGVEERSKRCAGDRWAAALFLGAVTLVAACSSSSRQPAAPASAPPAVTAAPQATVPSAPPPIVVESVGLREGAPGMIVDLEASGSLVWTSYRDVDGNFIVELPNSVAGPDLIRRLPGEGVVASLRIEEEKGGSRPLIRVIVALSGEIEHSLTAEGNLLRLELVSVPEVAEGGTPPFSYEPLPEAEPEAPPAEPEVAAVKPPPPAPPRLGTAEEPLAAPAPAGPAATRLEGVEVLADGAVLVSGDGEFAYSTFQLEDPERFVIDLTGVINTAATSVVPVGSPQLKQVRMAQFKSSPAPISRVVFDLETTAWPVIERTSEGLLVRFAAAGEAVAAVPRSPAPTPPAPTPPAQEPIAVAEAPAQREPELAETAEPIPPRRIEEPAEPERVAELPPAPPAEPPPSEVAPPAVSPRVPSRGPTSDVDLVNGAAGDVHRPPLEGAPATVPAEPGAPATRRQPSGATTLFGASQIAKNKKDEQELGEAGERTFQTSVYGARTIGGTERTYFGEPISMTLRGADVVETLRSFAAISGLSIVVQPEVTGSVTVELDNVPWDQALEQILRVNRLGYELEGTVMRIAPVSVLKLEAQEQQELAQAKALQVPLKTIMRRLSYAEAQDVSRLLAGRGGLLSQRGSVILDRRTNTLIIQELPSFMDTIIAVIDEIDTPEPQVMIEARIIETTKRFTRSLGVDWSVSGEASARYGNTTGLVFPNNVAGNGGVNLITGAANGFLDLTLGNVLNSFQLDVALQAAETEGLIKIISAPKVAVLNNQAANIQSGLQIPIQTVANNTVTVQFVNATLSFDVTPHVTAEGTVLMDIFIRKREPQLAFAVQGATNAPIATKEARTRVIVRDGGTTVIGGIYEVSSDQGVDRVPGLANIPIIGHLFKNKRRSDENEELLIFITPRVINL